MLLVPPSGGKSWIPSSIIEMMKRAGGKNLRVVDLCCGLGGLSIAAQQAGMTVAAGVDSNPHALKTFSRNFPNAEAIEGSIRSRKILTRCADLLKGEKGQHIRSLVVSGPPCQGFSMAGTRDDSDPRNQILLASARAIATLQPDAAVIENVSMVLAKKHGNRLNRVERILTAAGFHVTRIVLDASEFGVPQRRKRVFFLISRSKLDEAGLLSLLAVYKKNSKGARVALRGLPAPRMRPDKYDDELAYGTIPNHLTMQHSRRVMKKIAAIKPGTGPMSYRRLHPQRVSNTLFSGHRAPPAHFKEPRSITVREAARLQSIPDSFRVYGTFSNQMWQVTNAVPPTLGRAVLEVFLQIIDLPAVSHA